MSSFDIDLQPSAHFDRGKTILASRVIDHIQRSIGSAHFVIAFIYCDYKRQHEQNCCNLIGSLLKQVLQHQVSIPQEVMSSYRKHSSAGTNASGDDLASFVYSTVANLSRVFVVVDALDELSRKERQPLLRHLRALQSDHQVNIMTTSRHIQSLTRAFTKPLKLEIRASDHDIQIYVRAHLADHAKCLRSNLDLQKVVVDAVRGAADGT